MEELTLTTPSILFSAISLIMLAYTNRFLAYASVIRNLKKEHESNPSPITQQQMDNLRRRLHMTRSMQIYGRQQPVAVRSMHATDIHRLAENGRLYVRRGAGSAGRLAVDLDPRTADLGPRARSAPRPCGRKEARRTEQVQTFPEQKPHEKAPRYATGSSARLAARQPQRITRREEPRSIARGYRSTPEARSRTCG